MKSYTAQSLYQPINGIITTGKFEKIQGYLSLILSNLKLYGSDYTIQNYQIPVYRGMNPHRFYKPEDYKPNSIGTWTTF